MHTTSVRCSNTTDARVGHYDNVPLIMCLRS
nr:MAG TPA: hypothetical protein [Caudoviricetes sp.]